MEWIRQTEIRLGRGVRRKEWGNGFVKFNLYFIILDIYTMYIYICICIYPRYHAYNLYTYSIHKYICNIHNHCIHLYMYIIDFCIYKYVFQTGTIQYLCFARQNMKNMKQPTRVWFQMYFYCHRYFHANLRGPPSQMPSPLQEIRPDEGTRWF